MHKAESTQRHHVVPELRWHPPDGIWHLTLGTQAVGGSTERLCTPMVRAVTGETATGAPE